MEQLKIDYEFNLEDFKMMEDIEHSYFLNDNITPAEEVLKWYENNDLTCVGLRNEKNEIVASVSILPLKKSIFMDIYENKMNEAEVVAEQIEEYQDNETYYIYLSSISIDEKYRNNYKVVTTLLKGCINLFDLLKSRNIKIEKVMADASTIHGEKICKKLLRMNYITDTSHKSKIYCVDGEKFFEAINKMKKFIMSRKLSKEVDNNNITFQLANLEQFNEIYKLYNGRTNWFELNNIKQWPQYAERHESEIQKAIENDNYYIFKKGNEIIAGFEISDEPGYFNDDGQALYLHKVVVKVGYKNIGKLIFMASKDIAKSNNKQYLRLDCVKNNEKLNEIYEKHGFEFVGSGKTADYEYCLRECNINDK